jgi:hypothetical protein
MRSGTESRLILHRFTGELAQTGLGECERSFSQRRGPIKCPHGATVGLLADRRYPLCSIAWSIGYSVRGLSL